MLVALSCGARLPVYTLLVGAFIPDVVYLGGVLQLRGLTILAMYGLGSWWQSLAALVLKKTLLHCDASFVMELPSYKWPGLVVLFRMLEQGWSFVRQAGTLIFAVSVVVWAAAYYPRDAGQLDPAVVARHSPHRPRCSSRAGLAEVPSDDPRGRTGRLSGCGAHPLVAGRG
ncbi:MAG: hypothetical protein U0935_03445 [Pirellulales bacterium]